MKRLLIQHRYPRQKRPDKGLLRAYKKRVTGFSRAQLMRLIGGYRRPGRVTAKPSLRPRFQRRYTPADVELLADVDQAYERLSGPATRHILKREFEVCGFDLNFVVACIGRVNCKFTLAVCFAGKMTADGAAESTSGRIRLEPRRN